MDKLHIFGLLLVLGSAADLALGTDAADEECSAAPDDECFSTLQVRHALATEQAETEQVESVHELCCLGLTASCRSCQLGKTVEEFCREKKGKYHGCHSGATCEPPAQDFSLPRKVCPQTGEGRKACVGNNRDFRTFEAAWAACGQNAECDLIMKWRNGRYYMRRDSDPEKPHPRSGSMPYSCESKTCPDTLPAAGETCSAKGLQCDYSPQACGESSIFSSSATCEDNRWKHASMTQKCVPAEYCVPPVTHEDLPPKGCPNNDSDHTTCVAHNAYYLTFETAWAACGENPECNIVTLWTNGRYYLRRLSDPDLPPAPGASSAKYSCSTVFDPSSPLTNYLDQGGCGPRGDDAVEDVSGCLHGAGLIAAKPLDWHHPVVVDGCKYYAYAIFACLEVEAVRLPAVGH